MDIYVMRGAWLPNPVRPSLLQNNGKGGFIDITEESGLMVPMNGIAAQWADFDNDGLLDLFVCGENKASRLYRNLGDSKFSDVTQKSGLAMPDNLKCKGVNWIDFDNDGFQDLYINFLTNSVSSRLFHNERNGQFIDVSKIQGIDNPLFGFSCWSWDFNNDGWLDIFSTCYERRMSEVLTSMLGKGHNLNSNRLFLNQGGKGFTNITKEAGLDQVFATMGSNFGDLDNDGFLDFYLGTGEPDIATLIPNRMFKNMEGKRFAEITGTAGTGNLQKGHGTAFGDWDRDGNIDVFMEMGGAINGDKYHNILFQNPGHEGHWITLKLAGVRTNRPAIGARIKVVTAGNHPQTIYRQVSSGSSFGGNPMQQTIGLGNAERIAELEIQWPVSQTVQTFKDIAPDQALAIVEGADRYEPLNWTPIEHNDQSKIKAPAAKDK